MLLRSLAGPVRAALRTLQGSRLRSDPSSRATIRRLLALARQAVERRDQEQIELLERGLALLRRGHTAGERQLVAGWRELSNRMLLATLAKLPAVAPKPLVTRVELIGLLVVEARCEGR